MTVKFMKESLDFNGAGRHFLETVSYEHSNFSQACDAVILTHAHLKDRPRCIRDIPKTSSSSWSQDEEIQLRKLGVKTPRHVPVQCNHGRLKNRMFTIFGAVTRSAPWHPAARFTDTPNARRYLG